MKVENYVKNGILTIDAVVSDLVAELEDEPLLIMENVQTDSIHKINLLNFYITNEILDYLKNFKNLTSLVLGFAHLKDEQLSFLQEFYKLTSFSIISNPITNKGLQYLQSLSNLINFSAGFTLIDDNGIPFLKHFSYLSRLSLAGTKITDEGILYLKTLSNISSLWIHSNKKITNQGIKNLVQCENFLQVSELVLSSTQIDNNGIPYLQNFTNLCKLNLASTKITSKCLEYLKNLPNLSHLYLNNTHIDDDGLNWLTLLKNLTLIDLEGTQISEQGGKKIKESLPNCNVILPFLPSV